MILKNFLNTLRHYKLASILNVLGLAAAFAAFAIIMMQVLYDLRYDRFHPNADRIVRLEGQMVPGQGYTSYLSRPIQRIIAESSADIVAAGLINSYGEREMTTDLNSSSYPYRYEITTVSPEFLEMFHFQILAGDTTGFSSPGKWVISETIAKTVFPDENPVGRHFKRKGIDTTSYEVIAVYKDFPKNSYFDNTIYERIGTDNYNNWSNWNHIVFMMLSSADKLETVQQQMNDRVNQELETTFEDRFRLTPFTDLHFSTGLQYDEAEKANKNTTYTLLLIAILIITIAVINFVNFSTSLVPVRIKNINTQKVLGESVSNIRINMIFEAVGLSLIAVIFSVLAIHFLASTTFANFLSAEMALGKNQAIVLGTIVTALVTGLLAGIYPAYYITSFPPALVLKGSFGLSPKGRRLRTVLISFQYIISFTLITVAIFIHVQSTFMKKHELGFNKENILLTSLTSRSASRSQEVTNLLLQNPAVKGVTFASGPIVSNGKMGWGRNYKGEEIRFDCFPVSSNFISMMDMKISEGREFIDSDNLKPNGTIIFNEVAREMFNIDLDDKIQGHAAEPADIVGFVENFNFQPLQYGINPIALYVFGSEPWYPIQSMYVRIDGNNMPATLDFIKNKLIEIDPNNEERANFQFMDESIGKLYEKEDRLGKLISIFSLLAILISVIGVFGLIMFETQYRRKEIGIRKINGASVPHILYMLNSGFVRIVLVCFALSIPISYYVIQSWLSGFAYKSPVHVWIFIASLLIIFLITLLTVTFQSYKTATENPVKALKTE